MRPTSPKLRSGQAAKVHRVFQKPTQIAQIAQITLMESSQLTESICVICEISEICVGL
jgi:hypothetical protein